VSWKEWERSFFFVLGQGCECFDGDVAGGAVQVPFIWNWVFRRMNERHALTFSSMLNGE
jgi:hypothetical protein